LIVEESLFRDVLLREKNRADRFGQSFVLVVVTLQRDRFCDSSTWESIIEALSAVKRDTDTLGWYERGNTLAMILPEVAANDEQFRRDVESRVQVALARRVDVEIRESFAVKLYCHTFRKPLATGGHRPDPLLEDLRMSRRGRLKAALKRALDVTASGLLLLLAAPLLLVIAILVRLSSPGAVFFRQPRVGEYGKLFTMLKFRTMHVHSNDAIHKEFVSQLIKGAAPSGGGGATGETPFKIVNDPRVTTVGRVLRKTSLDELPQLWNVLRGEMSLVGPRPPLVYEVEQYKPWHYRRVLEAKPGITGLWQVSGRSRTTFDDMVRLDLRYAKNPSAWTDIKILVATPRAVISGKGAC